LVFVLPASALADVREPGRIRLARESLLPALPGQPYSGVVEFTSPQDGVIEKVEIGGVGWEVGSVGFSTAIDVKRGETIRIPFQADVKAGAEKLEIRVTVSGKRVEKKFDLSPDRIAALGKDRSSGRVDDIGAAPSGDGGDGIGPRGCDDYLIRAHGRIEYVRPDGQVIGVDGIRFQIMDEDTFDSEVIYEGYTNEQGAFDITTCWDDCDVSGCDDPDVYLRYDCNTGVSFVRNDDAGEDIYAWSTIDTLIFENFTGPEIDFGNQRPTDTATFPALHIHNSMVRAHRYVAETAAYVSAHVAVVWQDGPGAFYIASADEIHIGPDEQWGEGTQVHEWGHHLLYEWTAPVSPSYCNGFCDDPNVNNCGTEGCVGGGGHCIWCNETDTDAWNEGFPDWLGSVVMRIWQGRYGEPPPLAINDSRYTLEFLQTCCDGTAHNALLTEGFVGALLRDIEDPPQDTGQIACPQDSLALNGDEILAVVREYRPIRVTEFINGFRTEYPQLDHDFRSTAQSVAAVYVMGWTSSPLQVVFTSGCGTYRNGETITLSVQTNASRYSTCMQWRRDGSNLVDGGRVSGATTDTLIITDAGASDVGQYTLRITSCDGALPTQCNGTQITTSPPIAVRVISASPPAHRVTGWGFNAYGQLGRGTTIPDFDVNPGDVINLNNVVAVTTGQWNSHAILADGTVWGWGYQYLGDGTSQTSATPVQANGLTDIVAVSGGGFYGTSMALDASGHVWTWGSGSLSQLGYESYLALNPVQLDLECLVDISMGSFFAAAVTGDGSLWVWGLDYYGQAGLGGGNVRYWTPQHVTDLSNVVEVEVGGYHTLVRLADGTVWAAGHNGVGQLGDGTLVNRNRFVQVIGLSNVTQISAGWQHNLAVRADSTPWAWGHYWAVGTGSNTLDNPTPAPVLNLPTVRSLDAGNQISAFVDEDGTIWTCGNNNYGQLCRPTGTGREPLPVDTRVGAAVQVSAGGDFMMAIAPGARIIAPVTDQIAAGCATARLTVGAVGEPPLSYQWLRNVGGTFVPLNDGGRITGTTTPTLTIGQTDALDTGVYRVAVANATNVAFNDPVWFVTPPLLNPFDSQQGADHWWINERGNWAVTDGAYAAGAPSSNPATYSSFRLPLRDFLIELDVTSTAFANYNANGGIWLRSQFTTPNAPNYPNGVLLGFGSVYPGATGDLFWQRWPDWPQNVAFNVYTPGAAIHLRVEVRGNTYTAYLNDSTTPTTTLTTPNYPSGNIGLYDNSAAGAAYDNVFIQTLTSCDPNSGLEPVRILQRPLSQAVASGSQVTLSVVATGTGPLGYQWLRNGSCVTGANSPTYSFTASAAAAGRYECTVTNACGAVGSYPATVTVEGGGPPGDLSCDGVVNFDDINPFILALSDPAGYQIAFPNCDYLNADCDGDGLVDFDDINAFVAILSGG
jgi:alpha-tubulin suppressor-like RCC1 family protein